MIWYETQMKLAYTFNKSVIFKINTYAIPWRASCHFWCPGGGPNFLDRV